MKIKTIRYMPKYTKSKWRLDTKGTTASTTFRSNLMVSMAWCRENRTKEIRNIKGKSGSRTGRFCRDSIRSRPRGSMLVCRMIRIERGDNRRSKLNTHSGHRFHRSPSGWRHRGSLPLEDLTLAPRDHREGTLGTSLNGIKSSWKGKASGGKSSSVRGTCRASKWYHDSSWIKRAKRFGTGAILRLL